MSGGLFLRFGFESGVAFGVVFAFFNQFLEEGVLIKNYDIHSP
jgi:hypothetical protein